MKTEFTDVSETRKHLTFEVPSDVVDAEFTRVTRDYAKSARVPGFRPGKVPSGVIRQRYKAEITNDVAHGLIPRAVSEALRERDLAPVAAPDIRDVVLDEGKALTFLADFETVPPIDPGEYTGISLRKNPPVLDVGAVDQALDHLQQQHARWVPVEDRPAATGDTLLLDLTRTKRTRLITLTDDITPLADDEKPEALQNVSIEMGATANPPGFDDHLLGSTAGDTRSFTVNYPDDYTIAELAGAHVDYVVTVKGIRRKELLPFDDDFAKTVSELDTLELLRDRVRQDLQRTAESESEHKLRHDLLQHLATRMKSAPDALVDQELDRRLEELVRRLMEQGVDPMKAGIDWQAFRQAQRESAAESVRSTLVLDDIARREAIDATDEELAAEIDKFAERSGHTPAAVRARLEKDEAIGRIRAGIGREKAMAWLLERASVSH